MRWVLRGCCWIGAAEPLPYRATSDGAYPEAVAALPQVRPRMAALRRGQNADVTLRANAEYENGC
jgi:hypothetical protein